MTPHDIFLLVLIFSLFAGILSGIPAMLAIAGVPLITAVVASLFALPQMRRGYQGLAKWIDGFAGALFAGFGIHLIISR